MLIYSFYCCLVKEGWPLKVALQFTIWGLVAYKPVAYKKINVINEGTTTNYNFLLWLTLIKRHICTFCQERKFICVMLITKRLKSFLKWILQFAIPSYLPFLIFPFGISCLILITKSKNWAANKLAKYKNWILF